MVKILALQPPWSLVQIHRTFGPLLPLHRLNLYGPYCIAGFPKRDDTNIGSKNIFHINLIIFIYKLLIKYKQTFLNYKLPTCRYQNSEFYFKFNNISVIIISMKHFITLKLLINYHTDICRYHNNGIRKMQ